MKTEIKEIIIGALCIYLFISVLFCIFNAWPLDCKLRYADYVFPSRRLFCPVGE